ncbi:MAG TPA: CopD family protein [Telluria sp.]|nr:CopD family protein [Telluria sp.]
MTWAMDVASAQIATTVILNLSVAMAIGANASRASLRSAGSAWALRQLDSLRMVALSSVAVALAACFALLWLEAASMAEVPVTEAGAALPTVLASTHYGTAWTVGTCALTAFAILTALARNLHGTRATSIAAWLAVGTYLYTRSTVSHAGATGDVSWAVAFDWIHLALASLWAGEVLVAGWFTLRVPASAIPERLERAAYVQGLSRAATMALAGIVATGLFSAVRAIGSLEHASGNPYADTLLAKLALVALAAVLGGSNRFFVMPGLLAHLRSSSPAAHPAERRFTLVLQIEAIVLIAVLVAAALLSSTSPPGAG